MSKVYLIAKTEPTIGNRSPESLTTLIDKLNLLENKIQNISSNSMSYRISKHVKDEKDNLYDVVLGHIYFTFGIENINKECVDRFIKYVSEITLSDKKMIVTMNADNLLTFFNNECCKKAGDKMNDIAYQMLDICLYESPNIFKDAGAPCTFSKCDKKESCNEKRNPKIKQIIKTY